MKKLYFVFIVMLLVSISSICLFAGGESESEATDKITLRYAFWDGGQEQAMQAAIDAFMEANPDITVELELTEWSDYWNKITTGMAAGTMPDVFWNHLAYFPGLAERDALIDLKPLIKQDNVDTSIYYPGLVENFNYEGKQFGLSKDWDTICLAYNKELLKAAGVTDQESWEWDAETGGTFLKALLKLTIDANGRNAADPAFDKNNIVQYAIGPVNSSEMQISWINFIWMNGTPGAGVLDKPFGSEFTMDDPRAVAALQFFGDMVNKYCVAPSSQSEGFGGGAYDAFQSGKLAIYFAGSWTAGGMRELPFEYDYAPLPVGPVGRISAFNGLAHSIAANTENLDAAWRLVKWMDGIEGQEIIASYAVCFPSIPALMDDYMSASAGKSPQGLHWYIDEAEGKIMPYPQHVKWGEIHDIINKYLTPFFGGTGTAAEAVDSIKEEVEQILR